MKTQLPKVSICLLTYNRAALLPKTLDTLLAQTHPDFELIINDDRSSDNTEEICRRYERLDPRIRYFRNATNLRYAENQNAAISRAGSDYVAIVHDGDIYRNDLLEKWTRALVENPSAAIVFNALEAMDDKGNITHIHRHSYGPLIPGLKLFDEMICRPDSPIFGIVMVRRGCILTVGPFDSRLPVLADVDMWFRLLLKYDVAYVNEPIVCIAPHGENHKSVTKMWQVRAEHELIYQLNSARRYSDDALSLRRLRKNITPMLWHLRIQLLLSCIRHGRIHGFLEGLVYLAKRPRLWARLT